MKTKGLSIRELAAYIGVSTDTVRRAARRGEIPFTREGTAYRFDWLKVRRAMDERSKEMRGGGKKEAGARPPAKGGGARSVKPPDGNTGALTTHVVTGGLFIR
jgi:excisionase family DNA binding protein